MSLVKTVLLNAMLLGVYFAAGKFGLSFFGLIHPSASAIWLPTGVAMAAFLLFGFSRPFRPCSSAPFSSMSPRQDRSQARSAWRWGIRSRASLAVTLVERFAGGRDAFRSMSGILKFAALAAS